MQCQQCGKVSLPDRKFCDECGSVLAATTAPMLSPLPLSAGMSLGKYTIRTSVGRSQDHRYAAVDDTDKPVWIKTGTAAQLRAEAASLAAIEHADVARVVETFSNGGADYLVLSAMADLVPLSGAGLSSVDRILAVGTTLCEIAGKWQDAGFVYGGFSPESVWYQPARGRIWLPGGAATVDLTAGGVAPEVVAGAQATPAADVYGIAATIYRLLCQDVAVLPEGRTGRLLPPLESLRPDLPPDLCVAVNQGLAPQVAQRFQSPAALGAALTALASPLRVEAGSCTDRGRVRLDNQDCLFTTAIGAAGGDRIRAAGGVFVVCDGMGGEAGGEIASGIATETLGGSLAAFLSTRLIQGPIPQAEELESVLRSALTRANGQIRERTRENPALYGMGTTATVAAVSGNAAVILQVGDSRAYLWAPDTGLTQVTHDQSVVGQLVAAGKITAAEGRLRPDRNMMYQAVGSRESLEPEVVPLTLHAGEKLLLISDGVHGFVSDETLGELLARPLSPGGCANLLVNTAIAAGSDDNCSAVVVAVSSRLG